MLDVDLYKPKIKGESDKYSWNLYKFLNKQVRQRDIGKYVKTQIRVFWLTHSRWDGRYVEFNPEKLHGGLNHMQIIISPFGDRGSGYFLSNILGNKKDECFSLSSWAKDEFIDITEWFFSTYEQDGRCTFDREHIGWWQGDKERFTYINNTRRCNWCGQWHMKEIHKSVKIEREVHWK